MEINFFLLHCTRDIRDARGECRAWSLNNHVRTIEWPLTMLRMQTEFLLWRPIGSIFGAKRAPVESNQTFMLNHETIRMESANKRAGSQRQPPFRRR